MKDANVYQQTYDALLCFYYCIFICVTSSVCNALC